jgi:hypothetical protein
MPDIRDADKNKLNDAIVEHFKDTPWEKPNWFHWEGKKIVIESMLPGNGAMNMANSIKLVARNLAGKFKNAKIRISIEF